VEQPGEGLHARIGERLGEDEIAGPQQPREDRGHGVLAAARDEDAVGRDLEPRARDPCGARGAVLRRAAFGRVVEERAEPGRLGDGGESLGQGGRIGRSRRQVDAHVDEAGLGLRSKPKGHGLGAHAPNERSSPHLAGHDSLARRFGVGARDGPHRDPQTIGQIAMGRKLATRLEPAARGIFGDGFGDRPVARTGPSFETRLPNCHRDNIALVRKQSRHYLEEHGFTERPVDPQRRG